MGLVSHFMPNYITPILFFRYIIRGMNPLKPVVCALLLVGCVTTSLMSEEKTPMSIVLDKTTYELGDTAAVVISNHTGQVAMFALICDLSWEGRTDDGWETVYEPDCSSIRVRPTRLQGGDDMVTEIVVHPCDASALKKHGAFRLRIRFQFEDNSGYVTMYSQDVTITAP